MQRIMILLFTLMAPTFCFALSTDSGKVANIQSDSVEYNNKTGIAKYLGHVHATQGTTEIDADNVTLFRNNKQQIDTIIAHGKPAHYRTIPDHEKQYLKASAQTIEYYPNSGKIVLKDNATAKMGNNTFSGEHIIYDMIKQTVLSLPSKNGQTHIVIHPQPKASNHS